MPSATDLHNWAERRVLDANGEEIGHADGFYVDDRTGEPAFLLVRGGIFGIHMHFVPLEGSVLEGEDAIRVNWDKETINHAPRISADDSLSAEEEQRLFDHYGMHYGNAPVGGAIVLTRWVSISAG